MRAGPLRRADFVIVGALVIAAAVGSREQAPAPRPAAFDPAPRPSAEAAPMPRVLAGPVPAAQIVTMPRAPAAATPPPAGPISWPGKPPPRTTAPPVPEPVPFARAGQPVPIPGWHRPR